MPIYEYQCESCQKISEIIQKISDPHPETCPVCSRGPMKKMLSRTNFALKGGGWYSDAYSSKKPDDKAAKPATDTAPADGAAKPAAAPAATESKPSAASEPAPAKKTSSP
jgi:putative FmdB family regulatory protein